MKRIFILSALFLAATPLLRADEPVQDPLSLLDRKVTPLSPSVKLRDVTVPNAIDKGLNFLDLWQSPNGSWDRLENSDPDFYQYKTPVKLLTDQLQFNHDFPRLPGDGPVKDTPDLQTEQLADTCLSAQAMLRAVVSGRKPELSKNCLTAIEYVCKKAQFWNADTILMQTRWLDPLHDPAPYPPQPDNPGEPTYYTPAVDTFFALSFLVEARSRIQNPEH